LLLFFKKEALSSLFFFEKKKQKTFGWFGFGLGVTDAQLSLRHLRVPSRPSRLRG
jgi:hypothetical protein